MIANGTTSSSNYRRRRLLALIVGISLVAGACGTSAEGGPRDDSLDSVIDAKKLVVGALTGLPPFGDYDANNQVVGYDIDVVNLFARDLGVELEIKVLPDPPARISALLSGEIDISAGTFTPTPERALSVSFTSPYAPDHLVLFGRKSDSAIKDYRDLTSAHKVAVTVGTTEEIIATLNPDVEVVRVGDNTAAFEAFSSGQVNVVLVNRETAVQAMADNADWEIKGIVLQGQLAFGVQRDANDLRQWMNTALESYGASGELQALYRKWFNDDLPRILPEY